MLLLIVSMVEIVGSSLQGVFSSVLAFWSRLTSHWRCSPITTDFPIIYKDINFGLAYANRGVVLTDPCGLSCPQQISSLFKQKNNRRFQYFLRISLES